VDHIDRIIEAWRRKRPDVDVRALGRFSRDAAVIGRPWRQSSLVLCGRPGLASWADHLSIGVVRIRDPVADPSARRTAPGRAVPDGGSGRAPGIRRAL